MGQYVRNPQMVEAMCWGAELGAPWFVEAIKIDKIRYIPKSLEEVDHLQVDTPTGGAMSAFGGDWIVKVDGGFEVYSDEQFEKLFSPADNPVVERWPGGGKRVPDVNERVFASFDKMAEAAHQRHERMMADSYGFPNPKAIGAEPLPARFYWKAGVVIVALLVFWGYLIHSLVQPS